MHNQLIEIRDELQALPLDDRPREMPDKFLSERLGLQLGKFRVQVVATAERSKVFGEICTLIAAPIVARKHALEAKLRAATA